MSQIHVGQEIVFTVMERLPPKGGPTPQLPNPPLMLHRHWSHALSRLTGPQPESHDP